MRRQLAVVLCLAAAASLLAAGVAAADEGMWPFNMVPAERIRERHGFAPDAAWLDHVRLSAARLPGCSGSFVSPAGLVVTNHHCVQRCVDKLSRADRNLLVTGFYAATAADELRCPGMEVSQLVDITDVTDRVLARTRGLSEAAYNRAIKAEIAAIEKQCGGSDTVRCDVVSLYAGGLYQLYLIYGADRVVRELRAAATPST